MSKEKELSGDEVKKRLVQMLDAFSAYCRRHNLHFFLVGGTLLGAVRHKGFIPWDDDIDISMPRPDYEKLRKLVHREKIAENLSFYCGDDGTYSGPYGQLVDTDTRLTRKSQDFLLDCYVTRRLCIDIFPVDGFPDGKAQTARYTARLKLIRKMILYSRSRIGEGSTPLRRVIKFFPVAAMRLLGNRRLVSHMIRLCKSYPFESCDFVGTSVNGLYGVGERYRKEDAFPEAYVQFEGKKYPTLKRYKEHLRNIFGDYEKLPPKEKRISHQLHVYVKQ